jgi:FMN phosphatase YigB (HAD superfamily)
MWMIGVPWFNDVLAARAAGWQAIWLRRHPAQRTPDDVPVVTTLATVPNVLRSALP